jgi:cytochrome P450
MLTHSKKRHPCIGMKFAMQFIKVSVATLFKHFELEKKSEFEGSSRQLVGLAKPSKPLWVEYKRK